MLAQTGSVDAPWNSRRPALALLPAVSPLPPTNEQIANAVCRAFGVTREELAGRRRHRQIAEARMVLLALARDLGGRYASFTKVGSYFGLDHGTVLHACKRVPDLCSIDAEFAARVRLARKHILTR